MNGTLTGWQFDMNSRMQCIVKDGLILQLDGYGNTQQIGYVNSMYDEIVDIAKEYKNLCVENGIIEEEKTPEQIQAEMQAIIKQQTETMSQQAETMKSMFAMFKDLKADMEGMKNGYDVNGSTGSKSIKNGRKAIATTSTESTSLPKQSEE